MRNALTALVVLAVACGDAEHGAVVPDAGPPDALTGAALVARGDYLANHVVFCTGCHTPFLPSGAPDPDRWLSGVDCFIDTEPDNPDAGCLSSRNLTSDATGLGTRTDRQIKDMITKGVRPDGSFLNPVMPYGIFSNLSEADADAIVAYLRTIPGVDHTVMPRQAPFIVTAPGPLFDASRLPPAQPGDGNGRYLAMLGCLDCHTLNSATGPGLDLTKLFAGGVDFQPGFPSPPFPDHIFATNLTSHATGIAGYTAADIVKVLKMGVDPHGEGLCPPMPAGPMAGFGGLSDRDAMDIARYVVSLPPIDHAIHNDCQAPGL